MITLFAIRMLLIELGDISIIIRLTGIKNETDMTIFNKHKGVLEDSPIDPGGGTEPD